MTLEIWKWLSVAATGVFSVVAAYSKLRPKEQEPLYARIAVVGAVFSFLAAVLTQSLEQVDRTEKARVAAVSASQQAAAANETLRQIRRAQTVLRSVEFGPVFGLPTDRPPFKGYVDRLFQEANQQGIVKLLRPKAELTASVTTADRRILALDVRPGSRLDPARLGYPEAAKFLRNLGVVMEVYADSGSILEDSGRLRPERPRPAFAAWSEVTLPEIWRISKDGMGQTQWLGSNPRLWHRSSRVDSVEDLLRAEVLITIAAADNDNLDLRIPSDQAVSALLDRTTFHHMLLRVNERLLDIDQFRVASGTYGGSYFEVYRLPASEAELFKSTFK